MVNLESSLAALREAAGRMPELVSPELRAALATSMPGTLERQAEALRRAALINWTTR